MGVGFDPELSGARQRAGERCDARASAAGEVRERFPDIVAFARARGVRRPQLKNYSSGMSVRLRSRWRAGGRRRAADRRGAGGGRRRLSGKVLSSSSSACGRGPDDRASSPTTCAPWSASATARMLLDEGPVGAIGGPPRSSSATGRSTRGSMGPRAHGEHAHRPGRRCAQRARPRALARGRPRRYRPQPLGGALVASPASPTRSPRSDLKVHYLGSSLGLPVVVLRPLIAVRRHLLRVLPRRAFGDGVATTPSTCSPRSCYGCSSPSRPPPRPAASLLGKQELLRKLRFPRLVIPLSVVLKALFNLAHQLGGGGDAVGCRGRRAAAELAASCRCWWRFWSCSPPGVAMLAVRALRALPRRGPAGPCRCSCCSSAPRSST